MPSGAVTAAKTEHCPMCAIETSGCDGNPVGVAAGTNDDDNFSWCKINCKVKAAHEDPMMEKAEKKMTAKVQNKIKTLALQLMHGKLETVRGPLSAHNLACASFD